MVQFITYSGVFLPKFFLLLYSRFLVFCFMQPSETSPLFSDNLHFEHFDKHFKVDLWLTCLSKCSKWRLSEKMGLVSDGWFHAPHVRPRPERATFLLATMYPSQTKIGDGRTNISECFFEALFDVWWPESGILCSPNEDFGRPNQHFRRHFRSTFQGGDHSIWATSR
jgi:hypothetical protein